MLALRAHSKRVFTGCHLLRTTGRRTFATGRVIDINDSNWEDMVIKASSQVPVLVDFTAKWCGPCQTLGPVLEKLCKEEGVTLAKYDIDVSSEQSDNYGIKSIPAVYAFTRGKAISKFVGSKPEGEVRQFIHELKREAGTLRE